MQLPFAHDGLDRANDTVFFAALVVVDG